MIIQTIERKLVVEAIRFLRSPAGGEWEFAGLIHDGFFVRKRTTDAASRPDLRAVEAHLRTVSGFRDVPLDFDELPSYLLQKGTGAQIPDG